MTLIGLISPRSVCVYEIRLYVSGDLAPIGLLKGGEEVIMKFMQLEIGASGPIVEQHWYSQVFNHQPPSSLKHLSFSKYSSA